jgi:hypothetical protein
MFLIENIRFLFRKSVMPSIRARAALPVITTVMIAAPVLALAIQPDIGQHAGIAAVVLWLAGLGWGFHTMLYHQLAAEDRLARLETEIAGERDARAAQLRSTRLCMLTLDVEWQRLDECLRNGELEHVADGIRAVEGAISLLHETA